MTRTKWVRLGVRDPADILRWASAQGVRRFDEFRHRVIGGREFVSFRLVPRYAIEIGTTDILVVAHVRPGPRQQFAAAIAGMRRKAVRRVGAAIATLRHRAAPAPLPTAELYRLPAVRRSPSVG
ncbi:MAG TPA: hypothetical protein VG308_17450 [Stellaceae bacterium]|nr:hypothetical protein [Stellaceae bacterium]